MVSKSKRKRAAVQRANRPPVQAVPAPPRQKSRRARPRRTLNAGQSRIVSGSDLLETYGISSSTAAGTLVGQILVGPGQTGTRFTAEAALWSRWRPKKITLRVVLDGNRQCIGQLAAAWNPDTNWLVSPKHTGLPRALAAQRPHRVALPGTTVTLSLPTTMNTTWYACDGAPNADMRHGILSLATATAFGGFTGKVSVSVYIDWTVEFSGQEMGLQVISPTAAFGPDAGNEDIFTTSDGSFDGSRLTFKTHVGGSMTPFSASQYDIIYTTAPGTTVYYVKEDGETDTCKWFARVKSYAAPGLLLFASKEKAQSYITTGDLSDVLPYKTSSKYATPSVPKFVAASAYTVGLSGEAQLDPTASPSNLPAFYSSVDRLAEVVQTLAERLEQLESRFGRPESTTSFVDLGPESQL